MSAYTAAKVALGRKQLHLETDPLYFCLVSTGYVFSAGHTAMTSVAAYRLGADVAATGLDFTGAILAANSPTFSAVPTGSTAAAFVFYQKGINDAASMPIEYLALASNIPTNGGDIQVAIPTTGNKLFALAG